MQVTTANDKDIWKTQVSENKSKKKDSIQG